ncbi:MAG TPA: hypothetical protein P5544_18130 [Candidatus Nanopelagicales bacterium]|nr:hypothetical protein [Candidatus Nanopelagicales bacterium]
MSNWISNQNAEVVVAWATIAGAVVAAIAAAFALAQLSMIRRDSRERTRPYVQLDVVPGLHGPGSWDLIIENRGASSALNVVIDGGEYEAQDADDHIVPNLGAYLLAPKTLVPGARRRVMWGYDTADPPLKAGVLEPRSMSVTYLDERKARSLWGRNRPFRDVFRVGEALGAAVSPAPSEGSKPTTKDQLAHIDRALRMLNTHVGELRR